VRVPLGNRPSAIVYRLLAIGYWLSAIGYRQSPIGNRPSAIAHRQLSIGNCLSAIVYRQLAFGYANKMGHDGTIQFCVSPPRTDTLLSLASENPCMMFEGSAFNFGWLNGLLDAKCGRVIQMAH